LVPFGGGERELEIDPRAPDGMPKHYYADGSALSKIFIPQVGSETLDRILDWEGSVLHFSTAGLLEVRSFLARRLIRRALDLSRYKDVLSRIADFVPEWEESGKFKRIEFREAWEDEAAHLIDEARKVRIVLDAPDAIHAVLAQKAGPAGELAVVSTSEPLLEVAERLGLGVIALEDVY